MADLPEVNEWPEGIYQLETSDPVLGGPEGIDNRQAKQLANRTKWLKDQLSKIVDGVTSIGSALKLAIPRALNFKGAATGSGSFDGSADVEITLTLANSGVTAGTWPKVTVNSKGLVTGGSALVAADLPAGITAPQFDNDKSLATTEFVQRALGNLAGYAVYNANTALTAADVGKYVYADAATITLTLPDATLLPAGSRLYMQASANSKLTVTSVNGNITGPNGNPMGSPNVTLGPGVAAEFISWGAGWLSVGGTGLAALTDYGYQSFPGGLIIQWGMGTGNASGTASITFPIKFPNVCRRVLTTPRNSSPLNATSSIGAVTAQGVTIYTTLAPSGQPGVAQPLSFEWLAIGN